MKARYLRHLHYLRAHFLENNACEPIFEEKQSMREIVHENSADNTDFHGCAHEL